MPRQDPLMRLQALRHRSRDSIREYAFPQPPRMKSQLVARPFFELACLERAKPAPVRGPVLAPPCIRQRPLRMAGPLHRVPFHVLAPHRGAVLGSPGRLPFFNHPRRFAWGSLIAIFLIPLSPALTCCRDGAHYGLAATAYVDVLDGTVLFAAVDWRG